MHAFGISEVFNIGNDNEHPLALSAVCQREVGYEPCDEVRKRWKKEEGKKRWELGYPLIKYWEGPLWPPGHLVEVRYMGFSHVPDDHPKLVQNLAPPHQALYNITDGISCGFCGKLQLLSNIHCERTSCGRHLEKSKADEDFHSKVVCGITVIS